MAKYIIDLDAFIDCLDMTSMGKINGHDYTYLQNVRAFIERFPKQQIEETINVHVENDVCVIE